MDLDKLNRIIAGGGSLVPRHLRGRQLKSWRTPSRARVDAEERARASLEAAITAAFDGVQRGNGVTLHEAEAIAYYASDAERAEARLLDTEIRWQDVPESAMAANCSALSFFDAEGFRYYIPVFLIRTLNYFRQEVPCNTDDVFYGFGYYPRVEDNPGYRLLNRTQRAVIRRFLHFFIAYDPLGYDCDINAVHDALNRGWDAYKDG